jgi:hypothetical protein
MKSVFNSAGISPRLHGRLIGRQVLSLWGRKHKIPFSRERARTAGVRIKQDIIIIRSVRTSQEMQKQEKLIDSKGMMSQGLGPRRCHTPPLQAFCIRKLTLKDH